MTAPTRFHPVSLPFFISRRYLFSKKSHNAINIISAISAFGVAFATMALLCTLSVFNGFRELIGSLYTTFDPELEIRPAAGKFADADDAALWRMRRHPAVQSYSDCLEEQAMVLFVGRPVIINVKGVDDHFQQVSCIDSITTTGTAPGRFLLHAANVEYGVPSIGLTQQFGGVDYGTMPICAPRGGERINLTNPIESFNVIDIQSPGIFFQVHQQRYDDNYLLTSIQFARDLFEQPGRVSSVALRLKEGSDADAVRSELAALSQGRFVVLDRQEQHAETFRIMQIEKMMAYLFLTFIVLVASFNIISSVAMLIIDKRDDIDTLKHLGAGERTIVRIFLHESRMITTLGALAGILLGLLLCLLQQEFGLLQFGDGANFIVSAYPVSVSVIDVAIVLCTVLAIGFITAWYPVRYLTRQLIRQQ